jgi:hypothetical protein
VCQGKVATPKRKSSSAKKSRKSSSSTGEKKPLSGYMKFAQQQRPAVKEEFPQLSFSDLGKKLGELWRNLSEEEKQQYNSNHSADETSSEEESNEDDEEATPAIKRQKESNSSNGNSGSNEVLSVPSDDLQSTIRSSISSILSTADLSSISLKLVREKLIEGSSGITAEQAEQYKAWINQTVKQQIHNS